MENSYNAAIQSGASVNRAGNEFNSGMSNPVRRNKMVPPPLDGLASREYASAIRSLAMAQLNLPKYNSTPVYYTY